MKVYIAGPMSGYEDWNFPAFFDAEKKLLELGYEVVNPAHNDGETLEKALENAGLPDRPNNTWAYYMRRDLPHVLGVDILCVLEGWQDSKGASLEVHVAEAIGIPLMILRDGKLIPRVEVIGMSGWARAGKDTVADHLVSNYGYEKMSFASPMKDALYALNPSIQFGSFPNARLSTAIDTVGWEGIKELSSDIRPLLQRFGTEVGRQMWGENFWVNAAIRKIKDGSKVVFADVRFPNEANAIKELGGFVWRIERAGFGPANDHISEHAMDDYQFDTKIDNSGSIDYLYEVTDGLMEIERTR